MVNYKTVSDEDLYGMCMAGDKGAWTYVYTYILSICRWCRVKDPENVAGKVTVELLEKRLKRLREKNSFRYLLKTLALSRIKDSLKSAAAKEVTFSELSKNEEEDDPDISHIVGHDVPKQAEYVFRFEIIAIIDSAIEKISSACRLVIREYLRFKVGLYKDYDELSRVLKMPVPTISSRVSRCMKELLRIKEIEELRDLI